MKANYIANKSDQRRIASEVAKEEIKKQKAFFCPDCVAKMERQTMAIICKVLHDNFDFTKEQLEDVIDCAAAIGLFIHDSGSNYDITIEWLKSIGIDLESDS